MRFFFTAHYPAVLTESFIVYFLNDSLCEQTLRENEHVPLRSDPHQFRAKSHHLKAVRQE